MQKMLLLVKCHFTENLAKLRLLIISGLVHILDLAQQVVVEVGKAWRSGELLK